MMAVAFFDISVGTRHRRHVCLHQIFHATLWCLDLIVDSLGHLRPDKYIWKRLISSVYIRHRRLI